MYHMPTVDSGKYIHLQNNKSGIQSETQLELQQQVCSIRVDVREMWGEIYWSNKGETKRKNDSPQTTH